MKFKKMSEANIRRNSAASLPSRKGIKLTLGTRKKMSETHKKIGSKPPSRKGIKHTEEVKKRIGLKLKGSKSHLWKGGITPILTQIRESFKYNQWRQQIFIRDNFTCQECGVKGGYLHAHHEKPFHKFIEEIKKYLPLLNLYEGAMIYTPLWEIFNGKTLCKECHKKINARR
jgi:hypothetical protein